MSKLILTQSIALLKMTLLVKNLAKLLLKILIMVLVPRQNTETLAMTQEVFLLEFVVNKKMEKHLALESIAQNLLKSIPSIAIKLTISPRLKAVDHYLLIHRMGLAPMKIFVTSAMTLKD